MTDTKYPTRNIRMEGFGESSFG